MFWARPTFAEGPARPPIEGLPSEFEPETMEAAMGISSIDAANVMLLVPPFDNQQPRTEDWVGWWTRVELLIKPLPRVLKNYVLLRSAGSRLAAPIWAQYGSEIERMKTRSLVDLISRAYYEANHLNPIAVALWDTELGKHGVYNRRDFCRRLARLCFAQPVNVSDRDFMHTMMYVFAYHADEGKAEEFLYRLGEYYPRLLAPSREHARFSLGQRMMLRLTLASTPPPGSRRWIGGVEAPIEDPTLIGNSHTRPKDSTPEGLDK